MKWFGVRQCFIIPEPNGTSDRYGKMAKTSLALMLLLSGMSCSTTKRVTAFAESWNTLGDHRDCIFSRGGIYCLSPAVDKILGYDLDKFVKPGTAEKLTRTDALSDSALAFVHQVRATSENHEAEALRYSTSYDVEFNSSPTNYSLWDCVNTGKAEPAVKCRLVRAWTKDEIAAGEAAEQADDLLRHLTPDGLVRHCGNPQTRSKEDFYDLLDYPSTKGILQFRFAKIGDSPARLDWVEKGAAKKGDPTLWLKDMPFISINEALDLQRSLPCLK